MNISSYNITDVSYHYVGLRVVHAAHGQSRDQLAQTISAGVQKLVMDRALRLMLPAPRGTFGSVGEKVLNELRHFGLTETKDKQIGLTPLGVLAVALLQKRQFAEARLLFTRLHLDAYENLRTVVERLADGTIVTRPIRDSLDLSRPRDIQAAFLPWEKEPLDLGNLPTPKVDDLITSRLLDHWFPDAKLTVPIFRSMCDRLTSLRLVNQSRIARDGLEAFTIYGACASAKTEEWYIELTYNSGGITQSIFVSEFTLKNAKAREKFLGALHSSFEDLRAEGGFYDLPDVRDKVCMSLRIPEAAFDDAISELVGDANAPVSLGLRYERISGRRKPMVRQPGNQIFNLIRPTS